MVGGAGVKTTANTGLITVQIIDKANAVAINDTFFTYFTSPSLPLFDSPKKN
jgi:hypothetical protein